MTENDPRLSYLFQRFAENQCSKAELEELYEQVTTVGDDALHRLMDEWYNRLQPASRATQVDWEAMYREIVQQAPVRKMNRMPLLKTAWFRWAAAACILLAVGVYLWQVNTDKEVHKGPVASVDKPIVPGGNKALLTLADGRTIVLDSAATGRLTSQGNVAVMKLANGQLAYKPESTRSQEILMNTMHTPRGGQYQLILPDGTQAWLNAASSITYPVAFTGSERKVQVTGEVYFEVAKRKKMPFIVQLPDGAGIEVLGTHFNVNAYSNEPAMRTTLLEGSVKVDVGKQQSVVLKPGEQVELIADLQHAPTHRGFTIHEKGSVDLERVLAWKNGLFNFQDASLDEIMRQFERWYDIEIVYEGKVPQIELAGKLTRDVPLNDLLPALGKMGVHYKLEARRLTILKSGPAR